MQQTQILKESAKTFLIFQVITIRLSNPVVIGWKMKKILTDLFCIWIS